ncbi:hypothetical protein GCM10023147_30480 [Tsukamurella soli]|uniref:Uncharacterized protein n=1 Tax=Tsukamurella soli TaxID=644556 RepID=A0ABP8JUR0_9ACTN
MISDAAVTTCNGSTHARTAASVSHQTITVYIRVDTAARLDRTRRAHVHTDGGRG